MPHALVEAKKGMNKNNTKRALNAFLKLGPFLFDEKMGVVKVSTAADELDSQRTLSVIHSRDFDSGQGQRHFSFVHSVKTVSGAHPASSVMGAGDFFFSEVKRLIRQTDHPALLMPRLIIVVISSCNA
jgi:hypothetical protein